MIPNNINSIASQSIAIVDLGGQTCHLIGRRLRDLGIHTDIFDHHVSLDLLATFAGIILSGGPQSVYDPGAPTIDRKILQLGRPILGICYGHQLLAQLLRCTVTRGSAEFGRTPLLLRKPDSLFRDTPKRQIVWMNHSDSVKGLTSGLEPLATTTSCEVAAYGDLSRKLFGVQFHPEVAHTEHGSAILRNFGANICGISATETVQDRVDHLLTQIRLRAKDKSILFFVSGGVDSTVAFSLCARALPSDRVLGVYVDTGLMRKNETQELQSLLGSAGLSSRLHVRDESARFLSELENVVEPEKKRHIIGRLFIEIQSAAMREYGVDQEHWLLGQGTIYPDTIESGGANGAASVIKTHHNRCEEVRKLIASGRVIEPLSEFYKDEVRQIGAELGLGRHLTDRWPFPGPGLAIRVLCRTSGSDPLTADQLPAEFRDYQAAHFPLSSVGLKGDARTYLDTVAVNGELNYERLSELASYLCNTSDSYNRVIAYLDGKFTNLFEGMVVPRTMTRQRVELLREADHIVTSIMASQNLTGTVWQFPTILIPLSMNGGESIVLRPINSQDGMTANFARLPLDVLREIARQVSQVEGVDGVFLDITDKPPATIEWE